MYLLLIDTGAFIMKVVDYFSVTLNTYRNT